MTIAKGGVDFRKGKGKRTATQRNADLPVIAALSLRGKSSKEIAKYLSEIRTYTLTPKTINTDIAVIRDQWLESALVDYDTAKARELARIQKIEDAAWEAWERSWGDTETVIEEESVEDVMPSLDALLKVEKGELGYGAVGKLKSAKKMTKREGRLGVKGYLDIVKWCVEKRIKIYGLDAPQKVEVTWRQELKDLGLDPDLVIDGVARDIEPKLLEQ